MAEPSADDIEMSPEMRTLIAGTAQVLRKTAEHLDDAVMVDRLKPPMAELVELEANLGMMMSALYLENPFLFMLVRQEIRIKLALERDSDERRN